jgi:hypothetical protein
MVDYYLLLCFLASYQLAGVASKKAAPNCRDRDLRLLKDNISLDRAGRRHDERYTKYDRSNLNNLNLQVDYQVQSVQ